jgi:hypothetical protein
MSSSLARICFLISSAVGFVAVVFLAAAFFFAMTISSVE